MKSFKNFEELSAGAPKEVVGWYRDSMHDTGIPFEESYGGDVFLVETLRDASEITDCATIFDLMGVTPNNEYLCVALFWSEDGGPLFIIPQHIYMRSLELIGSAFLTLLATPEGPHSITSREL